MNHLAIVFPGQGSQFTGMGRRWYDAHQSVRERFDQASEIVGYSLEELCFRGDAAELTRTKHAQVALLVLGYAMYEELTTERKVPVHAMAGHSLGEITALAAAGAFSFEDAVRLVKVRGEAMDACATATDTGMIAVVKMPAATVEGCVAEFNADGHDVQVANFNAERQTVLSGTKADITAMTPFLEERGAKVARLNVAGAFHSSYMSGAVAPYVEAIGSIECSAPSVPVFSTVTGSPLTSPEAIRDALAVQLTSPVRWSDVVSGLLAEGVRLWLEVGPKEVLSKLISGVSGSGAAYGLDERTDEALSALDDFIEARRNEPGLVGLCLGAAAATRNRNFDQAAYSDGVITPYRALQKLSGVDKDELTLAQKQEAVLLLRRIMITKEVPVEEQQDRITTILSRTGNVDLAGALA